MDPIKPGVFTTEFWLKLLAGAAAAVLTWLTVSGGPLDTIADQLKALSPVLLIIIPLAKTAVVSFCAWCLTRLAEKYGEIRLALKLARMKAVLGESEANSKA